MPRLRLTGSTARIFGSSMLAVGVLVLCGLQLAAQDSSSPEPTVRQAVGFAVSPPVRELAKLPRAPRYGLHEALLVRRIAKRYFGLAVDPAEQNTAIGAPAASYTTGLDFLGVGNGFPSYTVPDAPPDTNMAVGDTQIVQWVNVSFAVFNKFNGATLAGPIDGNLLFTALGGPCATFNDGDIIAQWDNAAHRWLLAQNVFHGPPYYACVAVSTSADALGTYYLYQFSLGNNFPDYPKWGRWNTSWAQTMNSFGTGGFVGPQVCVYNRTKLLNGQPGPPAVQVCFQLAPDGDSLLPADIDSPTNPPSGEDQFFIGSVADVSTHQLSLYSVHVDWLHPSGATITGNHNSQLTTVPVYTGSCGGNFGGACVPQKGVSDMLDSLGDRLMYRFAYYNDAAPAGKQHWYVNHDVEAIGGQIGVRWYEFQAPKTAVTPLYFTTGTLPFQTGTYAPDSNYRWMGSLAADMNNDILAGYSESSSSMYPSIDVAGRLKTDPPNTLESEVSVVAGAGSQPDTANRWGDYSAMRLDPDGCTFWYTTEYYMVTQRFDWSTQIANIKFAGCHNPAYDGYIELCKQTDPDYPVSGTFNFTLTEPFFSTGPIGVPVGACSPPIRVPSGIVTVTEAPRIGVAVENVTAYSYDQFGNYVDELDSWTPPQQTATVTVVPGGVNLETIATFTNYAAPPGTLKICKIAGSGITVGTNFTFIVSGSGLPRIYNVPAGPPPGGSCEIVGTFPVNTPLLVAEIVPPGVSVSNITVEPPDRGGHQTSNSVVVTIGSGVTEVDFTDVAVVIGSCEPSSSLSVLLVNGTNVVAYVPEGNWNGGNAGVAVANIEGNYVVGAPFIVHTGSDVINSCASDPLLSPPQTLCTANYPSNLVYVIQGNPPQVQYTVASSGSSEIHFSGGSCLNCGVAMDALHSKAVLGISINGVPGFQFLDLNGAAPIPETPPIPSTAGQIAEDPLIDPISNPPLLLSPGEGTNCVGLPPGTCKPNYEIVDITDTRNPVFYENELDVLSGWPGGRPDSAGADCSAQIALAQIEDPNPSTPYIADLTKAKFNVPTLGMWSDTASQFYPLSGSLLDTGPDNGPVAVAQGGSHEGVFSQEFAGGNTITAFRLNAPYNASMPFADWVTCNLGGPPGGPPFAQGADPHTVTAYQSPNGSQHSFAVIANVAPASALAVVDLDMMLSISIVPRYAGTHVCSGGVGGKPGTLPSTVVRFPPL